MAERSKQPKGASPPGQGFYARGFKPDELAGLDQLPEKDLSSEIAMIRIATRRVFEAFTQLAGSNNPSLDDLISALGALGLASIRTSNLLKSQSRLADGSGELDAALSEALNQIYDEWRLT